MKKMNLTEQFALLHKKRYSELLEYHQEHGLDKAIIIKLIEELICLNNMYSNEASIH